MEAIFGDDRYANFRLSRLESTHNKRSRQTRKKQAKLLAKVGVY